MEEVCPRKKKTGYAAQSATSGTSEYTKGSTRWLFSRLFVSVYIPLLGDMIHFF